MERTGAARQRDEEGVVALIVALLVLSLLVVSALVIDIAQARLDRQASKSAADASVMAGLQSGDGGSSDLFTRRAVCGALAFLRSNDPALAGLPAGQCGGGWATDGTVCDPSSPGGSTVDYNQSVTSGGVSYAVQIKAPYQTSEGDFPEESYGTLAGDQGAAGLNGCDQLAVIITKSRDPLFGRVVSDDPLVTTIRSVGRVSPGDGDTAPALLLLERTQCNVLALGAAGGSSHIRVFGTDTTPGSIHADTAASDGGSCGTSNGRQVFQGKQAGGIVAYGSTDGDPGLITSVAAAAGVAAGIVSDGIANVYGTTAPNENVSGSTSGPLGRSQVTRKPVDERYLSGVRSAIGAAAPVWGAPSSGYTRVIGCNPTAAAVTAVAGLNSSESLYIDCPGGYDHGTETTPLVVGAGTVFLNGWVKGGGLHMPHATRVYVNSKAPGAGGAGIRLGTNNALCMGAAGCSSSPVAQCPTSGSSTHRKLFLRTGTLTQTGGILRACSTTVYLLGGASDGCLPASNGTAPTSSPCPSGAGDGQLKINGGATDWTAPNQYPSAIPEDVQDDAWRAGEDLALWAESAGEYTMAGGGLMQLVGVLMAPNAAPFNLTGGGAQALTNAQYVVRRFTLAGGGTLSMSVDPNSAVTLPRLESYLVR